MKQLILSTVVTLALISCSSSHTEDPHQPRRITAAGETADYLQITQSPGGQFVAWWVEQDPHSGDNYVYFSRSANDSLSFGESRRIPSSREINAGGEHMPKLIIKPDGTWVLIFARRNANSEAHFASSVLYTHSFDGGDTWTTSQLIHTDADPDNSHGFPEAVLLPDGEVAAVWLDGRHHLDHSTLYFAKTDGKNGFGTDKQIGGPACQCCKLDMYVDQTEMLHLVYRGLTGDNIRDIQHIASDDNGESFSPPARVSRDNWQIRACPHNGPSITRTGDELYVTWYSEGGGKGLYYATSENNGLSFSPRTKLTSQAKHPYIASFGHSALAIWDEVYQHDQETYRRIRMHVVSDKKKTQPEYITPLHTDAFMPYLFRTDDGEIIASWTQTSGNENELYYQTFTARQ